MAITGTAIAEIGVRTGTSAGPNTVGKTAKTVVYVVVVVVPFPVSLPTSSKFVPSLDL